MAAAAKQSSITLYCTAAPAASVPIGSFTNVNIQTDASDSTTTKYQIPTGQTWVIEDMFIQSGGDGTTKPQVQVIKNNGQIMCTTPVLTGMLVTNNSRPPYARKKVGFRPMEILSMKTIATVANGTAVDSVTFYVVVSIY